MYKDYSIEVIDSLLNLDYDLVELNIMYEYFSDMLSQKNAIRDFFENAVSNHTKYNNKMFENVKKIKLKLEINNETELLTELNELLKQDHDGMFVTYEEGCDISCLINYKNLCDEYIRYIKRIRIWLIKFAKSRK